MNSNEIYRNLNEKNEVKIYRYNGTEKGNNRERIANLAQQIIDALPARIKVQSTESGSNLNEAGSE